MDEPGLSQSKKRRSYQQERKPKPPPKPLGKARLEEMALAYVARFATSAARLEAYLMRKLRERGWEGEEPSEGRAVIGALVERFVEAGYVDDANYARMKAGSLLRRGFGGRRIAQALGHDGIDEAIREDVAPDEAEGRAAALGFARKRRFGPYTRGLEDGGRIEAPLREKQMAAMLRAGHAMSVARAILDAADAEAAQAWVDEATEEE